MQRIAQSPTEPAFVQDPYAFYERARALGSIVHWDDYAMPAAFSWAAVNAILRDRRFGRETPTELAQPVPQAVAPFYAVEANSMLELEPPRHTRLRALVLHAFTSRRIAALAPEIAALATTLARRLPRGEPFDLLEHFAQPLPVIVIARLLGVPDSMAQELLRWSRAMVRMYLPHRTPVIEAEAVAATQAFTDFLRHHIAERRSHPADDLITHLIAAEEDGARLSTDELISTCILLLNAGHEATVHTIGNGVHALLRHRTPPEALASDRIARTVEEILRWDPPLHLFTRWAYEEVELLGHHFRRGDRVACLLGAANRDPKHFDRPARFNPLRADQGNVSFGAGLHFCVGAPLARLELQLALPALFAEHPALRLKGRPRYADLYHFHGLERLTVIA